MKLMVIVLNKTECLDTLLERFCDAGITGATILDSCGMAHSLQGHDELRFIASLRLLLDPARTESKTILTILRDEEVDLAANILNEVTGGLEKPDTGVFFTLNVDRFEGADTSL